MEDLDNQFKYDPKLKPANFKKSRIAFDPIEEEIISNAKIEAYREKPYSNLFITPRQNKYAIDMAENLYETEINDLVRRMAQKTIKDQKNKFKDLERPIFNSIFEPVLKNMVQDISQEVVNERNKKIKLIESSEIKKVAKEKLVNDLMLDHMLDTVAQHGKVVAENDDVARLLDGMILNVLLLTHRDVRKIKEKTVKNYPLKKFHLNSFMNVVSKKNKIFFGFKLIFFQRL